MTTKPQKTGKVGSIPVEISYRCNGQTGHYWNESSFMLARPLLVHCDIEEVSHCNVVQLGLPDSSTCSPSPSNSCASVSSINQVTDSSVGTEVNRRRCLAHLFWSELAATIRQFQFRDSRPKASGAIQSNQFAAATPLKILPASFTM
ncbi:hypothetical protein HBN81_06885 [Pseudomonas fragi]|nr:hypothetical protein [Pseudomonas fragi]NNA84212.1 hypothetical protein [Pseudomonas fragi]NNB10093.1 hypothetical protein [Pseudomonas fragi]NNB37412.1 hypothetical protein [Pseudomonas fragi]